MTDDSMSDDVFESPEETKAGKQFGYTGSLSDYSRPSSGYCSRPNSGYFDVSDGLKVVKADDEKKTPSPTGYRDYTPPVELLQAREETLEEQMVHKTILLGDSGVGKTSLLVQFDTGKFQTGTFSATVGIGFTNKVVTVDECRVKLQIWDTAGQERFRSVTHAYYRDAHALLLLYDVTNKASFDNIRAWLAEIREYAQDDVVIMLLGNKSDCGTDRIVRKEDGERLSREYNVTFMETSAKTGLNVDLAFHAIAKDLKSRKSVNSEETKFNVQEYVREQTQRNSCTCNT